MPQSVSVIIPCYNEEVIIERNYDRVRRALEVLVEDFEIIIANDGSSDRSGEILRRIRAGDERLVLIDYHPNRGMGYACRQLFNRASRDLVIEMDADLAMDPRDTLPSFLRALAEVDCVVGSRYVGVKADYPLRRRIASRSYYLLNQLLFRLPLQDTQSGFFGIKRPALQSLRLERDGFELHLEMFVQLVRKGYVVREIPIRFVHQTESGEVSVLRAAPRMFLGSLRIWRSLRATK